MRPSKPEWNTLAETLALGELRNIRRAARGSTHDVYRVQTTDRDYAVRIPRTSALARHARFSRAKAGLWELASDIHVGPRYFGTLRIAVGVSRLPVSVTGWLEGRHFNPVKDAAPLGEALARLHSQTFSNRGSGAMSVDLAIFLKRWMGRQRRHLPQTELGAMLRERLRNQLASRAMESKRHDPGHCLVHNDLVPQNIIVGGGEVRLIDWDWAMWSNPATDLFCYLSPFVRSWERPFCLSASTGERFLRAYLASADRFVIAAARDGLVLWDAYNAGAAAWLYGEAPVRRRHFANRAFHEWAFAAAERAGTWLRSAFGGGKAS